MGAGSSIEWTEATWNPLTGCDKISPGCKHCYAERMAVRLKAMGVANYANGFDLTLHESALQIPLGWRQPRTIFVNSMSDLFHKDVPLSFIQRVFDVIQRSHWHQFQMLTKRADRLSSLSSSLPWPDHLWMGVSIESAKYAPRIDHLRSVPARVRFLSLEPLLGPLPSLDLCGIHWVIVGGESGPGARAMDPGWVRDLRDQCVAAKVPFFFKQWGGVNKKKTGRTLDDRTWDELPSVPVHLGSRQRSLPLLAPDRSALSPATRGTGRAVAGFGAETPSQGQKSHGRASPLEAGRPVD
ncbi:MAG: phage Gp37/Gp68 family protein [Polyangiales bacterium]